MSGTCLKDAEDFVYDYYFAKNFFPDKNTLNGGGGVLSTYSLVAATASGALTGGAAAMASREKD